MLVFSSPVARLCLFGQAVLQAGEASAAAVRIHVNMVIAHVDRRWTEPPPEPAAVDAAIRLLGELVVKYTLILRHIDVDLTPVAGFDIAGAFREPWLPG